MQRVLRRFLLFLVHIFGRPVIDERTGVCAGKVLRVGSHLFGELDPYQRLIFLPRESVSYWRAQIGFSSWPEVDYPRIRVGPPPPSEGRILWVVLVHHAAEEVMRVLNHWTKLGYDPAALLIVHGGKSIDFEKIDHPLALFVDDPRLRTRNHPEQKQSYTQAMRMVTQWVDRDPPEFLVLVEWDHRPLCPDWGSRLLQRREEEDADVLFHRLTRVDGTNAPHLRYHRSDPAFSLGPWRHVSLREEKDIILNALATGSFWTWEAFHAVAQVEPTADVYLEMDLPSLAHHLGFRVRCHGNQDQFVGFNPVPASVLDAALAQGAWSLHPVKAI